MTARRDAGRRGYARALYARMGVRRAGRASALACPRAFDALLDALLEGLRIEGILEPVEQAPQVAGLRVQCRGAVAQRLPQRGQLLDKRAAARGQRDQAPA